MSKIISLQNYIILYLSPGGSGKTGHINPLLPTPQLGKEPVTQRSLQEEQSRKRGPVEAKALK